MENILTVIKGCVKKEHRYQKMVYEHYYGFALKIAFRYIYRYEKAVDVTNDGFVKFFQHFDRFVPGNGEETEKMVLGFIKRVIINTAIDELRRGKLVPEIGGIPESVWEWSSKDGDADQLLLYKELIILVKKLPPKYRIVFNLYVIDGYNHLEIADIMKISVGTSKSCLSRARALLQQSIKKTEETIVCTI